MKVVFENDTVKISKTGRDYDFIAVVENKVDKEIRIVFTAQEMECLSFSVGANDWVGLLADDEGYSCLSEIEARRFAIVW